MRSIKIHSAVLKPLAEGESLGMPTYRVVATVDGKNTVYDMSVEVDGRDLDFVYVIGWEADHDTVNQIFWELCESPDPVCVAWRELHFPGGKSTRYK